MHLPISALAFALSLFTQSALACGSNCGDKRCTVVDDASQYNFSADEASREASSASDCHAIKDGWPTGESEFSDETWEEGGCKIRLIKGGLKDCISWDELRAVTDMLLDQACDDDTCKGGIEPSSASDDSYKALDGSKLCVMGADSTCYMYG